jgi:phospholipase C
MLFAVRPGAARIRRAWVSGSAALLLLATSVTPGLRPSEVYASTTIPIKHIVVIEQENHSFDNVLGRLCANRCDGASQGKLADGSIMSLPTATDTVPNVAHNHAAQVTAVDGGKMDGFAKLTGCSFLSGYACYEQFDATQIPNLTALFQRFAVSDRTFELDYAPSWGSHLELAASQLNGFIGDNPHNGTSGTTGPGWGCDSFKDSSWVPPTGGVAIQVPSCIPKSDGTGPYRPSPVTWVPTIMDRLAAAGRSWKIYAPNSTDGTAYGWAICPTFADCLYTSQASHMVPDSELVTDAAAGTLPSYSVVIPVSANSQHNGTSMKTGDAWIAHLVNAIQNGPDWGSTAIFITYDDCGCFYDHVPPPSGLGIRVPMVIVSPFVRSGYTDSNIASFDSILAYVEHTYHLPALSARDGAAYDYASSFNYAQAPLAPAHLTPSNAWAVSSSGAAANPDDPT